MERSVKAEIKISGLIKFWGGKRRVEAGFQRFLKLIGNGCKLPL